MNGPLAAPSEFLPEIDVAAVGRQPRLTVAFRLILLIPHYIVLGALGITSGVVGVITWFAALFTAHTPDFARRYQTGYINRFARVSGYSMFLTSSYPPFAWQPTGCPVVAHIPPPTHLNRWTVFFRGILRIPAAVVVVVAGFGLGVVSVIVWIVVLVLGRTPGAVFQANAAVLRYTVRYNAYWLMLTPAYRNTSSVTGSSASPGRRRRGRCC
ncbi:DUF4389 domain-containing protein [Tsukamurella soli]|uniref:DUF4389 domain-containing protein n=2 Tax=Tsukamurella soli TaxID=644556 RepID=A0ABP8J6H5_9ACTN